MLKEWLRVSDAPKEAPVENKRMVLDPEQTTPEATASEKLAQREEAMSKKLKAGLREGAPNSNNMLTYDSIFRGTSQVLMESNGNHEPEEGIQVNVSRHTQNTMMGSKWSLGGPMPNWEVNLQMNGFRDMVSASYNTLSRWMLVYQRSCSSGALLMTQCMMQKQQGMSQGTFVGMVQYPWTSGGCTQLQYVKDQTISLSHFQRLIRGVYFGSQLNFDPTTKGTSLSYGFMASNAKRTSSFVGELKPATGEWKLAHLESNWNVDMETCAQIEYSKKHEGSVSILSFGMRRQLIGGGSFNAVLSGFKKVKTALEIPFGGAYQGINQVRLTYNCDYEIVSGQVKQGLTLSL